MATRRKAATRKTSSKKATAKKKTAGKKASKKRAGKKTTTRKTAAKTTSKKQPEKPAAPAPDNVVAIRRYTELSITQISLDTGITRKTIRKRLAEAHVEQARLEKGYPVYRLKDILPALFTETEGTTDPDKLRPFERRAYYQGERDKLALAQERGELVPAFEVERTFANMFKTVTQGLETLPDVLERDAGIQGHVLVMIEQKIDELREVLASQIDEMQDDADSAVPLSG